MYAGSRRDEREQRLRREGYERMRAAHALTCRKYGQLTNRIGGTGDRYRCPGCGRQFTGARHPC